MATNTSKYVTNIIKKMKPVKSLLDIQGDKETRRAHAERSQEELIKAMKRGKIITITKATPIAKPTQKVIKSAKPISKPTKTITNPTTNPTDKTLVKTHNKLDAEAIQRLRASENYYRERLTNISNELRHEGELKGVGKGARIAREEIASRLLDLDMSESEIMHITRLNHYELEKVRKLASEELKDVLTHPVTTDK